MRVATGICRAAEVRRTLTVAARERQGGAGCDHIVRRIAVFRERIRIPCNPADQLPCSRGVALGGDMRQEAREPEPGAASDPGVPQPVLEVPGGMREAE